MTMLKYTSCRLTRGRNKIGSPSFEALKATLQGDPHAPIIPYSRGYPEHVSTLKPKKENFGSNKNLDSNPDGTEHGNHLMSNEEHLGISFP
jgi:hypothetical protein